MKREPRKAVRVIHSKDMKRTVLVVFNGFLVKEGYHDVLNL